MNRSELRQAVFDRLAIKTDGASPTPNSLDPLITNTFVNTALNQALNRVSMERDWWWLAHTATLTFDTTYGQSSLPSDFMRANQLVINDSVAEFLPFETYLDPLIDATTYGWTIYGSTVKITPIPSSSQSGTLYYFRSEPALSSDANSPLMPAAYHYIIVAYAAHLCAARRQDEQRATLYLQEYNNYLNSLNDDNRSTIKRRIKYSRRADYASWQ